TGTPPAPLSFPTRRSSDLRAKRAVRDLVFVSVEGGDGRDGLANDAERGRQIERHPSFTRGDEQFGQPDAVRGVGEHGEIGAAERSEEHTSELQSLAYLVCR